LYRRIPFSPVDEVSKQRPSTANPVTAPSRDQAAPRSAPKRWLKRVFKNSYTRAGRRRTVRNWSVKIQFQGIRQTFSLAAATRSEAAREAEAIYETLVREGWQSALLLHKRRRSLSETPGDVSSLDRSLKMDLNYWKARLIFRRYQDPLKAPGTQEYSTRIEHEGIHHYFPLGTDQPKPAAARALEIYRSAVSQGWRKVCARFPREFTVAIFWTARPLACTYTTLHTFVENVPRPSGFKQAGARKLALVEAEPEVRRTLEYWLNRQPGFEVAAVYSSLEEAWQTLKRNPPDFVLVNRVLRDAHRVEFAAKIKSLPDLPWFTFGVFEESDQIFISVTGVDAGYFLQRRRPTELLDPVRSALRQEKPLRNGGALPMRAYFQELFRSADSRTEFPGLPQLTFREKEILHLLSKGLLDKEIADNLGISPWTVHNHLKKIFDKLDVHTRTEAVVKYLQ
jgi:DNA-binding NarL/FixJ family response regulator